MVILNKINDRMEYRTDNMDLVKVVGQCLVDKFVINKNLFLRYKTCVEKLLPTQSQKTLLASKKILVQCP